MKNEDFQDGWERRVIERLATDALKEQRRARRWGIFFKVLGFGYLTFVLVMALDWTGRGTTTAKHTALVEVTGVIDAKGNANADRITHALGNAFKDANTQGIILRINSPGGSPVQAGIIYDEVQRLREKFPDKPLYAVIEDICASGGYYIASAADRIYVDKASIVGSIGVVMDGFGFTEAMQKLGVERRLITAGENKSFLDPFSPPNAEQQAFAQGLLAEIHQQFIDVVKRGRGDRLKDDPKIFSGLVWSGAKSIEMGLTDAMGSVDHVAREVIKAEQIVDYSQKESFAERVAKRVGASAANTFVAIVRSSGVALQ